MNVARKAYSGIIWLSPIHRWTTAVTVAFLVGTLLWILMVSTGLTSVAKAPNEVVLEVYRAAQDRDADRLRGYLADDAKTAFDALPEEDVEALLARLSHDHTTTVVEPLGIRNYGSHAVVGIMQDYGVRDTTLRVEVAVKEGRFWRLEWPLGATEWGPANQRFDPFYRSRTDL